MPEGLNAAPAARSIAGDVINWPNALTFGRICAVPVAVWLVLRHALGMAAALFIIAALTDALDGALARKRGVSALGTVLDPVADKLLLISMFVTLAAIGRLPVWLAILVVFRDLIIVGGIVVLRLLGRSVIIKPLLISKLNTVAQLVLVAVAMLDANRLFQDSMPWLAEAVQICVVFVAATTMISGAGYVLRGARLA